MISSLSHKVTEHKHFNYLVPLTGIEPVRQLPVEGFSYHYSFRYNINVVWTLPSSLLFALDAHRQVSTPSYFNRLGSVLPLSEVSPTLMRSTSFVSERALSSGKSLVSANSTTAANCKAYF